MKKKTFKKKIRIGGGSTFVIEIPIGMNENSIDQFQATLHFLGVKSLNLVIYTRCRNVEP